MEQDTQEEEQKHAGGRPLKFASVTELQKKIDAYFNECDPHPVKVIRYEFPKIKGKKKEERDHSKPPIEKIEWTISPQNAYTITGLANFLETSRETLINYEKRGEFFDTIKAAKDRVEEFWEHQLLGAHATGPIFNLKNNYGWEDKSQVDHSSLGKSIAPQILSPIDPRHAEAEAETATSNPGDQQPES